MSVTMAIKWVRFLSIMTRIARTSQTARVFAQGRIKIQSGEKIVISTPCGVLDILVYQSMSTRRIIPTTLCQKIHMQYFKDIVYIPSWQSIPVPCVGVRNLGL